MYKPVYTKQFAKEVKKSQKRGKNLDKFKIIAPIQIPNAICPISSNIALGGLSKKKP